MPQRVLLAGSTGLVGRGVCSRLSANTCVQLVSLVRRPSRASDRKIDYERLCESPEAVLRPFAPEGIDLAISCLGTTIRAAGSQSAMFRVDHDYVLAVARGALALGARQFILVSSAGAGGPGFYLRTKGAIERAVCAVGFARVDLMRPGFLLGDRDEGRFWEAIAQRMFTVLAPVMRGPDSRYGAISADTVARAIASIVGATGDGRHIHENEAMRRMG